MRRVDVTTQTLPIAGVSAEPCNQRSIRMKAALLMCLIGVAMNAYAETETFDSTAAGALPAGWKTGVTGQGAGSWAVSGCDRTQSA